MGEEGREVRGAPSVAGLDVAGVDALEDRHRQLRIVRPHRRLAEELQILRPERLLLVGGLQQLVGVAPAPLCDRLAARLYTVENLAHRLILAQALTLARSGRGPPLEAAGWSPGTSLQASGSAGNGRGRRRVSTTRSRTRAATRSWSCTRPRTSRAR